MEGIQVLDFEVKSSIHNYKVKFIDNFKKTIANEIEEKDIIIIDKKIETLYEKSLKDIKNKIISIQASENQKSYGALGSIIENLIQLGFKKNHRLVGIGGGIIQDITAFISSIMFRGVNWVFFPTTLLAQGDSCIGSKTSINFGIYKNQIGGFYPPNKIFICGDFLNTLSKSDIQSGFGEMAHYFIVAGEKDFYYYRDNYKKSVKSNELLLEIISKSLTIKKKYIELDEFDQKERLVFNYGHTFGHAIETLTNYKVPHGIAVSFGMDIANFISVEKKYLNEKIRLEIRSLLKDIWSGFSISNIDLNKYRTALSKDKKTIGNKLRLILCRGYGDVFVSSQVQDNNFNSLLNTYFLKELG